MSAADLRESVARAVWSAAPNDRIDDPTHFDGAPHWRQEEARRQASAALRAIADAGFVIVPDETDEAVTTYPKIKWSALYDAHFPERTDGTSRFAKLISQNLASKLKGGAGSILRKEGFEVDRWAGAIGATVKMLWEARQEISRLQAELARSALSAALKEMGAG